MVLFYFDGSEDRFQRNYIKSMLVSLYLLLFYCDVSIQMFLCAHTHTFIAYKTYMDKEEGANAEDGFSRSNEFNDFFFVILSIRVVCFITCSSSFARALE